MTPPHSCLPPLCACAAGKRPPPSAAVAARIAATMAVAGLAARPALDLLEAGGAGAGAGAAGRGPCAALSRLCPGAAALTRTTLIVAAAVTLLAVVALTVRLTTAPPPPPPLAATPARHPPQVVAPAAATAGRNGSCSQSNQSAVMESTTHAVNEKGARADAADAGVILPPTVVEGTPSLEPADEPTGERAHRETERAADEVGGTKIIPGVAGPPEVGAQPAAHLVDDDGGEDVAAGVPTGADMDVSDLPPVADHPPLQDDGLQQHDAGHGRHRRPPSAPPRRTYRPRYDHGGGGGGGAAPAWRQFEGCALHLRAAAPAPHSRHGDRHALLRAPLPPLHIMAPAAWPAQQHRGFPAPHPGLHPGPHHPAALWGLRLVPQPQQPVWGPATSAAPGPAPGPAPWGRPVRLFAPGLPCQLCPTPVLHLPGGGHAPAGPGGPAPQGPTWTC